MVDENTDELEILIGHKHSSLRLGDDDIVVAIADSSNFDDGNQSDDSSTMDDFLVNWHISEVELNHDDKEVSIVSANKFDEENSVCFLPFHEVPLSKSRPLTPLQNENQIIVSSNHKLFDLPDEPFSPVETSVVEDLFSLELRDCFGAHGITDEDEPLSSSPPSPSKMISPMKVHLEVTTAVSATESTAHAQIEQSLTETQIELSPKHSSGDVQSLPPPWTQSILSFPPPQPLPSLLGITECVVSEAFERTVPAENSNSLNGILSYRPPPLPINKSKMDENDICDDDDGEEVPLSVLMLMQRRYSEVAESDCELSGGELSGNETDANSVDSDGIDYSAFLEDSEEEEIDLTAIHDALAKTTDEHERRFYESVLRDYGLKVERKKAVAAKKRRKRRKSKAKMRKSLSSSGLLDLDDTLTSPRKSKSNLQKSLSSSGLSAPDDALGYSPMASLSTGSSSENQRSSSRGRARAHESPFDPTFPPANSSPTTSTSYPSAILTSRQTTRKSIGVGDSISATGGSGPWPAYHSGSTGSEAWTSVDGVRALQPTEKLI